MRFKLTVLGAGSAVPTPYRFPTSQVLVHHDKAFLIDCGEGAQLQMSKYKIKRSKIEHIFISHLHGDHVFGLPGFLSSLSLGGRTKDMHIFGPKGIKKFVKNSFLLANSMCSFRIYYHKLKHQKLKKIASFDAIEVFAFPLKHRVPTYGYLFKEKQKPRNFKVDILKKYMLDIQQIKALKRGQTEVIYQGKTIDANDLLLPKKARRSYAFCSDTVYDTEIVPYLKAVSLLYHESTYLDDMSAMAHERMHSTSIEAAKIASLAEAKQLLLGHYSSRYKKLDQFQLEAQSVFPNVLLAKEGKVFSIE